MYRVGKDECKASLPAIPLCHLESSHSVLSGSEQKDKTKRKFKKNQKSLSSDIFAQIFIHTKFHQVTELVVNVPPSLAVPRCR